MIKVKSFTTQLKIFHARQELDELDKEVCGFIASQGIRKVISIGDASTTGEKGDTIGLIRVLTYEEPVAGSLEDLKRTGGEAWEDLRKGADAALDELKKGVEGAIAKLKKD
jgi:hypothetical protein